MYTVIARYKTQPDTAESVAQTLPQLAQASRLEAGNISYEITRDLEDATQFVIIECYHSAADFQAHRDSEHFQELGVGEIIPLLDSRQVETFGE